MPARIFVDLSVDCRAANVCPDDIRSTQVLLKTRPGNIMRLLPPELAEHGD
jgi:hypothetical protein